jgi:hypothetical protein
MVLILKKLKQYADCKRANKMIDKRFMDDLAADDIIQTPQVNQDTLLASGPVTSDMPQTGVRVGRAGITPEQSAKAGGLERPAIALLDTLAGALRGFTAQVGGLPGDIRSVVDMINKEGAQKYLGSPTFATTEEILKDSSVRVPGTNLDLPFPQVVPSGVANEADRQKTVEFAQEAGTFLPGPGLPEAAIQGVKAVGKAVKATKGLPVGMSTKAVGEGVDELGFYSAAKQAVDAIQQPKGTGDQFLKQIEKTPGVKPDEIKWTGLDDFLKSKKTVTKAEVQEYLDKNKVEIKEIQMGGGKSEYPHRTADEWQGAIDKAEKAKNWDEAEKLTMAWEEFELGGKTKFAKYTLPGGENYREILLTLPPKQKGQSQIAFKSTEDADNFLTDMSISGFEDMNYGRLNDTDVVEFDGAIPSNVMQMIRNNDGDIVSGKEMAGSTYGSPHFEQPNILAHLRVNDRVIDGKKTLFIEEVQSDWHQAGRKKGYQGDMSIEQAKQKMLDNGYSPQAVANSSDEDIVKMMTQYGVPNAPFKTTWSELSMKRAIQLASEGGYDRIAFTTGKTQAARYDLSKQVKMISAMPDKNGTYNIYIEGNNGDALFRNQNGFGEYGQKIVTPEEFEELVGKDAAKTIMQKSDELNRGKVSKDQFKFYDSKPADLTIGGEGMKGFYDDILPKFLNKYAKKWDAKVGKTQLYTSNVNIENKITFENGKYLVDSGDGINYNTYSTKEDAIKSLGGDNPSVSYIDITPKMRESVVTKGQPMFAIGAGGAGAAATQTEDNK